MRVKHVDQRSNAGREPCAGIDWVLLLARSAGRAPNDKITVVNIWSVAIRCSTVLISRGVGFSGLAATGSEGSDRLSGSRAHEHEVAWREMCDLEVKLRSFGDFMIGMRVN